MLSGNAVFTCYGEDYICELEDESALCSSAFVVVVKSNMVDTNIIL